MTFITFDEKEAQGGGIPDSGTYDVFIKNVDINYKSSIKGSPGTELLMVIRDDVDQSFQGSKIYDRLFDSEAAKWRYQQLLKAVGSEQGQQFADKKAIKDFIIGKPIKVTVQQEQYKKNDGSDGVRLNVTKFEETHQGGFLPPEPEAEAETIDISEDDLPF